MSSELTFVVVGSATAGPIAKGQVPYRAEICGQFGEGFRDRTLTYRFDPGVRALGALGQSLLRGKAQLFRAGRDGAAAVHPSMGAADLGSLLFIALADSREQLGLYVLEAKSAPGRVRLVPVSPGVEVLLIWRRAGQRLTPLEIVCSRHDTLPSPMRAARTNQRVAPSPVRKILSCEVVSHLGK
jgi:hypothetical protein